MFSLIHLPEYYLEQIGWEHVVQVLEISQLFVQQDVVFMVVVLESPEVLPSTNVPMLSLWILRMLHVMALLEMVALVRINIVLSAVQIMMALVVILCRVFSISDNS